MSARFREWSSHRHFSQTLVIFPAGGVFFFGHLDQQAQDMDRKLESVGDKLDDVRERTARIEGHLTGISRTPEVLQAPE